MEGERDVTIRYVTDGDYRPKYANGVYGGIGTRGEVVMNFFTEGFALPDTLPVCQIERDYTIAAAGQLRTRFQAFVESLEIKRIQAGK